MPARRMSRLIRDRSRFTPDSSGIEPFPQDEKENLASKGNSVQTRVLYLRGDRETGNLEDYVKGLRESGLPNVEGRLIPNSGHYAPDEQPGEVVAILRNSSPDDRRRRFNDHHPCLLLDDYDAWTLNASLTTLSSYRKCSKRWILGHSAQATSLQRIEGMIRH